jgi:hypothetical protein
VDALAFGRNDWPPWIIHVQKKRRSSNENRYTAALVWKKFANEVTIHPHPTSWCSVTCQSSLGKWRYDSCEVGKFINHHQATTGCFTLGFRTRTPALPDRWNNFASQLPGAGSPRALSPPWSDPPGTCAPRSPRTWRWRRPGGRSLGKDQTQQFGWIKTWLQICSDVFLGGKP